MSFCIFILCIDGCGKRAYDLQGKTLVLACLLFDFIIKLVLERNEFDQIIDAEPQHFRYERLSYEIHCTQRQSFSLRSLALIRGKEDDGYP